MKLTPESIKGYKEAHKKGFGEDITLAQAEEYGTRLVSFFALLMKIDHRLKGWEKRLITEPKGFAVQSDGYSCKLCGQSTYGEMWYDDADLKCLICQRAVDQRIVPKYACRKRDSWYDMGELKDKFNLHPSTVRKMIRNGELKGRVIYNQEGNPHIWVFLKKENILEKQIIIK